MENEDMPRRHPIRMPSCPGCRVEGRSPGACKLELRMANRDAPDEGAYVCMCCPLCGTAYDDQGLCVGQVCTGCGEVRAPDSVDELYSYGIYAGRLCERCALGYRDHCGLDQPQGDPADLAAEGETIDPC